MQIAAANRRWATNVQRAASAARPPLAPAHIDAGDVPDFANVSAWSDAAADFRLDRQPLLLVDLAAGEDPATTPEAIAGKPVDESLFSLDYLKTIGRDIKATFTAPARWDRNDWLIAGGVAAAIGVTYIFDQDIRNLAQHNNSKGVDNVLDALEPFGAGYSLIVIGGFYLGGELFDDARAKETALDSISASLITSGLIVTPLKYITGRSRPREGHGPDDWFGSGHSFPSGHATQAFTVATVISRHYPSPWVRITTYGLATSVALARINNDAHWGSDVLAGAAIGTFVGNVVVDVNQQHRGQQLSITPMADPQMVGVMVTWSR